MGPATELRRRNLQPQPTADSCDRNLSSKTGRHLSRPFQGLLPRSATEASCGNMMSPPAVETRHRNMLPKSDSQTGDRTMMPRPAPETRRRHPLRTPAAMPCDRRPLFLFLRPSPRPARSRISVCFRVPEPVRPNTLAPGVSPPPWGCCECSLVFRAVGVVSGDVLFCVWGGLNGVAD